MQRNANKQIKPDACQYNITASMISNWYWLLCYSIVVVTHSALNQLKSGAILHPVKVNTIEQIIDVPSFDGYTVLHTDTASAVHRSFKR